jgi:hypothetical protein
MNPTIVGLVGNAGAGKDTAAEVFFRAGYQRAAFADPIKTIAVQHYGWNGVKDERGRKLLQDLGMAGREFDPEVWIRHMRWSNPIRYGKPCVITDVRFENEAQWIRRQKGKLVRIVRPDIVQIQHVSETEQKSIACHYEIVNAGTVQDLHKVVEDLILSL